jgi:DNA-binding transcriptional MerR regulator
MPAASLTISEIARLLNIPVKAIRHYHEVGVLAEPERAANGYRLYSGVHLRQIMRIRELQAFGLSLRQIGFILSSDEPDAHLRDFLARRDADLADEIDRLQRQRARVRAFLSGEAPLSGAAAAPSEQIVRATLRPVSGGMADVLAEVEAGALAVIDRLPRADPAAYALFWEQVAAHLARVMRPHEGPFILWLERYLALASMAPDDRQAQSWLNELRATDAADLLAGAFALQLPEPAALPLDEQAMVRQMIPLLLYEDATPLQRAFLAALTHRKPR